MNMGIKFESVDVLDFMRQVVELNTQFYKEDFDMDKELIQYFACSDDLRNQYLFWMSRSCGTYTLREWDVYLQDSPANKTWLYYYEQNKDSILAYAVKLDGIKDGKVIGSIFPLDYSSSVERTKLLSCPIEKISVLFQDGTNVVLPYENYCNEVRGFTVKHGRVKSEECLPESMYEIAAIIRKEYIKRNYHARSGNIQEYMNVLKKASMRGKLKEAQTTAAASLKLSSLNKRPER